MLKAQYYGPELFKIMTQIVLELKCSTKGIPRMRTFLLSLIIFFVFLESIPAFALSNGWPVPYGSITSGIGWRKDPFGSGKMKWHNGIDIAVALYTPVTPAGPGMIRYAGWHKDYGWLVVVDHHNGWFSMYGHNYTLAVQVGQEVTPETVISYAGSTGKSTGVHVHFERRWYPEGATPVPVAAEVNNIREYSGKEIQQPQGTSEQSAEEIQQSTQTPEQSPEVTRQPRFKSYNFTRHGGVGGE